MKKRRKNKRQTTKQRYILYDFIVAYDGERDTSKPSGWIQQVGKDWYGYGNGAGLLRALVEGMSSAFVSPQEINKEIIHCYSGFYRTYDLIPGSEDVTEAQVEVCSDGTVHELCSSTTKEKRNETE